MESMLGERGLVDIITGYIEGTLHVSKECATRQPLALNLCADIWRSQQLFLFGFIGLAISIGCILSSIAISHNYFSELPIPYTVKPPGSRPDTAPEGWNNSEPLIKLPGSNLIHCYAPATGEFLGARNPSTTEGIDRAVAAAKKAQGGWERTTFTQRRQVLRTLLKFVLENQEQLCHIACLDSGKTMIDAALGETLVTAERLKWTIQHGETALRPSRRPTNLLLAYKRNEVHYEALGVVAALVSWNYPFHNLIGPIITAIFAGNGIVVKASEHTAWSASYFTLVAKAALQVCGHNPDLVQSVICWPKEASYLTSHPDISHVTFIGSRPVAHHVAAACAKSLTPLCAELGGKDACIVLDSAKKDLVRIADIAVRGTFQSSGQNCVGIERIICGPVVYEPLISLLTPRVKGMRVGSILNAEEGENIDMGAMVSSANFDKLEQMIKSACQHGARLIHGGKRYKNPKFPRGHYFQPTLLVDVDTDMEIANVECFAPICLVMEAKDTADAIRIANDPKFGLGASVYGKKGWELTECVRAIRAGMVAVNDFAVFYAVQMPFGGVGGSGYGRFAGEEGLRGVSNLKAVCVDRWDSVGIQTSIPPPLKYPIRDMKKGWKVVTSIIELGYKPGWWAKAKSVGKLAKNSF